MLTDDEIYEAIERGEALYVRYQSGPRGMTIQPTDDVTYCVALSVARAAAERMRERCKAALDDAQAQGGDTPNRIYNAGYYDGYRDSTAAAVDIVAAINIEGET
jgi:DNA invertase Pin-like site-specific DNA recombinase